MKLIENWKDCWKWYSTHATAVYMALAAYYVQLTPEMKADIPTWMLETGIAFAAVTFIVARIVKQGETTIE